MFVLLITVAFISVAAGSVSVNIFAPLSETDSMIIFDIRMPRTLLAAVSGAALAVSGYLLQKSYSGPLCNGYIIRSQNDYGADHDLCGGKRRQHDISA